ncbi:MAG: hypothetical protein GKR98_05130 [Boseongicola sp.]|nr:MAG: hypothetical protein GKR98_05130 [Boseongicola sp.]
MIRRLVAVLAFGLLAACGVSETELPTGSNLEIAELAKSIRGLGPEVDAAEADRAARLAYEYTAVLKEEYQITSAPLVHNSLVNIGLKPRGLCWHWAEDMELRLKAEGFETLSIHRAIANSDNPFRIEHSTAIVSRIGDTMIDGIVLDPWRYGGFLFTSPVRTDGDYNWLPQQEVLAKKRAKLLRERQFGPAV